VVELVVTVEVTVEAGVLMIVQLVLALIEVMTYVPVAVETQLVATIPGGGVGVQAVLVVVV
jgi:hypothetical protein